MFAWAVLTLWPFILVAAVLLTLARPAARLVFFVLGLLFFLAVWFVPWGIRSLHGEYMVIAFPGLALCVSAILAEAASRVIGALRARRQHR